MEDGPDAQIRDRGPASASRSDRLDGDRRGARLPAVPADPAPLVPPVLSILSFVIASAVAMLRTPHKGKRLGDLGDRQRLHVHLDRRRLDEQSENTDRLVRSRCDGALSVIMEFFTPEAIAALFQVVMIDLALAGDNAIVVGMAAAGCRSISARGRSCSAWRARRRCLLYSPASPPSS